MLTSGLHSFKSTSNNRADRDRSAAASGVVQSQPTFNAVTSFPFTSPALNALSLHPRILGAVSQLVRQPVANIRLCGASLNGKYGPEEPSEGKAFEFSWANKEGNQPMHQGKWLATTKHLIWPGEG